MKMLMIKQAIKMLALIGLGLSCALSSRAQTTYVVNNFDSAAEVTNNAGYPWINWFGTAYSTNVWDPSDASGNTNSGSLKIVAVFPDAGVGGQFGPQFVVMDNYGGLNPPGGYDGFQITNFQCDIRFDPTSQTQVSGGSTNYGTVEFGSRGTGFNQPDFGSITPTADQTNWIHVSLPVDAVANAQFTNLPNVFVKMYSGSFTSKSILFVDNIKLVGPASTVTNPPPTMAIQKAVPSLRIFAGSTSSMYDREQLASLDQKQSWVGTGTTYPVSYSFTLLSAASAAGFQTHIFLIPVNFVGNPVTGNEYMEYQSSNTLWLQILAGVGNVTANISWKTNLPNANPNNVALQITNSTAVGTWTLTFNNANSGTLTAPGAAPAAFTIADANITSDFANPLVAAFGVQPNATTGEGQYDDYASITTSGVSGTPINDIFANDSGVNTGVWDASDSALSASVAFVSTNNPVWVNWTTPDPGFGLAISQNLTNSADRHLPGYYNGFFGNQGVGTQFGLKKWVLVTPDILPSNLSGTADTNVYFLLSNPPPAD
jgi:hypothetical protein